jgi:hypothetical protein
LIEGSNYLSHKLPEGPSGQNPEFIFIVFRQLDPLTKLVIKIVQKSDYWIKWNLCYVWCLYWVTVGNGNLCRLLRGNYMTLDSVQFGSVILNYWEWMFFWSNILIVLAWHGLVKPTLSLRVITNLFSLIILILLSIISLRKECVRAHVYRLRGDLVIRKKMVIGR